VEDIYSVFAWLHANAGRLGLDPARIGIKGESGGGGFAAAAALYARDQQGLKLLAIPPPRYRRSWSCISE
jgi:acetyl esterase/lipase